MWNFSKWPININNTSVYRIPSKNRIFKKTMISRYSIMIRIREWSRFIVAHSIITYFYAVVILGLESIFGEKYFSFMHILPRVMTIHIAYLIVSYFYRVTNYPPGPPPIPIFGNAPFINIQSPEVTFLEYRQTYGPVFTLYLPEPTLILADYESIHDGLITNGPHTAGRSSNESFVLFTNDRENGDGVILAMRQKWKKIRSEITRFMGTLYGDQMDELIMHHTRCLEKELLHIADNKSLVDLRDPLAASIANVIQQITIGRTFLFQDQEFQDQLSDINTVVKEIMTFEVFLVNSYPFLKYLPEGILRKWTNYKKSGFRLQNWFRTMLEDHLINRHQGDFMSYMVEKQQSGSQTFSDLSIILTCGDIWTGGMETTVTTLRWGIIYLLQNPEVQRKCHEEVVKVYGDREPEMRRMLETPYIRATLSEIQRLANVLPWAIPHKTLEDCKIRGYKINANMDIVPAIGVLLADPNVYESPKQFNPSRFLDNEGNYKNIEEFRPFGMGPRVCLGERIARTELYLIFCCLMQNFRFYLNPGDPIPTTERVVGGITSPPKPHGTRVEYLNIRKI